MIELDLGKVVGESGGGGVNPGEKTILVTNPATSATYTKNALWYRKIGDSIVEFCISGHSVSNAKSLKLCTLQDDFIPEDTIRIPAYKFVNSSPYVWMCLITIYGKECADAGNVYLRADNTSMAAGYLSAHTLYSLN